MQTFALKCLPTLRFLYFWCINVKRNGVGDTSMFLVSCSLPRVGTGQSCKEVPTPHVLSSMNKNWKKWVFWPWAAPPALYPEAPELVPIAANTSQQVPQISGGCKRDIHTFQPLSADSGITQQAAAIIFIADATSYRNNLVLISPYNSKQ